MILNKVGMPLYTKSVSHPCPSGRRSADIGWVHGRQYGILLAHAAWAGGLVAAGWLRDLKHERRGIYR